MIYWSNTFLQKITEHLPQNTENEEQSKAVLFTLSESVDIEEQPSIEGQLPLEDSLKNINTTISDRNESVSVQSVERGFLAEQMSLERGSPPHFEPEVTFSTKFT